MVGCVSERVERDVLLGHGVAKFLKERLLETADVYHCYVCNQCGLFAQRMLRKDNKPYPTKKDIYYCQACRNHTDISKIRIPYAFKLLIQELMAMNICARIKVKKNASD
jgi:DNA-directed RNA polymerase II subunit RPB2